MLRHDLIKVANNVLADSMKFNLRGWEICDRHDLNERQFKATKVHIKRIASLQKGWMWGYDPYPSQADGVYRICPADAPKIAERMLQFAIRSWHDEGNTMEYMLRGARRMGYMNDASLVRAIMQTDYARGQIMEIAEHVVISEKVGDSSVYDLAGGPV